MFKRIIALLLISVIAPTVLAQEKLSNDDAYRFFLYIKATQVYCRAAKINVKEVNYVANAYTTKFNKQINRGRPKSLTTPERTDILLIDYFTRHIAGLTPQEGRQVCNDVPKELKDLL